MREIIPYRQDLVEKARELRNNSTGPEIILWKRLKKKQVLGVDFHRQKPLVRFIVDFYAPDMKLAVELDGEYHVSQGAYDYNRDEELARYGVKVIRFKNEEVLNDINAVIRKIAEEINYMKAL